ncbi:hypothetical protein B0H17DRAFT_892588, partial [Mycena rosella]
LTSCSDIRVEWTKACACTDRWREELVFLEEEMRSVLQFCSWKAAWWDVQQQPRPGVSCELTEGLCTYASDQAVQERRWKAKWEKLWQPVHDHAATVLA